MKHNKETGLMAKIKEKGISVRELSEISGVGIRTLYRKLKGEGSFTVDNIQRLSAALGLNEKEIMNIFFSPKVS